METVLAENAVLEWIGKEESLGVHLSPKLRPQGGFSKTEGVDEFSLEDISHYLENNILA